MTRRELARENGTLVSMYRGVARIKPSWSTYTYPVPETITIAERATSSNAAEWGVGELYRLSNIRTPQAAIDYCARRVHCSVSAPPKLHRITARYVRLCNGRLGWLNAYSFVPGDEIYEQVFARAGNRMYVAALRYQNDAGDTFHAAAALTTLCPGGVGEVPAPKSDAPFALPGGWIASTQTPGKDASTGLDDSAGWFSLHGSATVAQWLALGRASDVSEYITPQQEAEERLSVQKTAVKRFHLQKSRAVTLCRGVQGWFAEFTAQDDLGYRFLDEEMYAYGSDESYMLQYTRSVSEPEDPAARKALYSLCPPQSHDEK